MNIETIRKAIQKHRNIGDMTDGQVRLIWNSLTPADQAAYAKATKGEKQNAPTPGPQRNL